MDWVEYDETSVKVLPQWARESAATFDAAPYSVSIVPEGVVLRRGSRASALRWVDVLAPIRLDDAMAPRLLLAWCREDPRK